LLASMFVVSVSKSFTFSSCAITSVFQQCQPNDIDAEWCRLSADFLPVLLRLIHHCHLPKHLQRALLVWRNRFSYSCFSSNFFIQNFFANARIPVAKNGRKFSLSGF
jgi:hypothetical protein